MKKLLFVVGFLALLFIVNSDRLVAMPLQPDFVDRLRSAGKLKEVTQVYREAQDRWQIDRVALQGAEHRFALRMPITSGSGIAVLIDFDDNPADTSNHPPAAYDTLLYSVHTYPTGSMKDFYRENSFGKFNFSGGVAPQPPTRSWFRSALSYSYYAEEYGFPHSQELANEAVALADSAIDFGQYDNDGPDGIPNSGDDDGMVDAVYIVHSDAGYEEGGAGEIWSHMSWTDYTTNDPAHDGGMIKIGPYSIQPEEHGSGLLIDVGVFCHEYGHILRLPDLYDYDYDSHGAGEWTLMAAGSWNGYLGSSPAHLDAWCKTALGWVDPLVVNSYLVHAPIPEIEHNAVIYKLWTDGAPVEEYFLVENRQRTGLFDSFIPSSGLLIYHIDESIYGNDHQYIPGESPPGSAHFQVAVEQADGLFQLERNSSPGDNGDPFPGSKNRNYIAGFLPYPTTFDYEEHDTKVAVLDISASDSLMYANFDVGRYLPLLSLKDFSTDDQTGGDGDGRAEPGETVKLSVTVENRWGDATGVSGRLVSLDPTVSINTATAPFGTIPAGSSGDNLFNPFIFTIIPQAQAHTGKLVLELTSNLAGYKKSDTLRLMVGWPGIMVVDDDDGDTVETCYQRALDNLNLTYDYWNVKAQGSIAPSMSKIGLQDSIIIWFTGRQTATLSAADISALTSFLNSGGKLFLSSQNAGEELKNNSFYSQYLHARFIAPNAPTPIAVGIPTDPIGLDDSLAMGYLLAGSKDVISPISPATMVFTYKDIADGGAGIKYADGYQVVYFGFPFEAVAGNPKRFLQQEELMARILNWFGLPVSVAEDCRQTGTEISLLQFSVSPNPFNNHVSFQFQLPQSQHATLKIYDASGKLVSTLLKGNNLKPAHYNLHWNSGKTPAGVYFYNLETEGFKKVGKLVLLR